MCTHRPQVYNGVVLFNKAPFTELCSDNNKKKHTQIQNTKLKKFKRKTLIRLYDTNTHKKRKTEGKKKERERKKKNGQNLLKYANVPAPKSWCRRMEGWKEGKDGKGTQHLCIKCRHSKPIEKMCGITAGLKGME